MNSSLLDLNDALNWTRTELKDAINAVDQIEDVTTGQWPETKSLKRRLEALYRLTESIVPSKIQKAINGAIDEYQHVSDMADAQSY